jgi:hypothetical protein
MWKHLDALFRLRYGTLGFVAMPNVWIFQILFPLISPVMDLMLIYTLVSTAFDRWQQPTGYASTNLQQVLFYYALFLAIDWLSSCFAFVLERKERWRSLWWLFLQRFCYRQVMYYVMIKSVAMAIGGPVVGWGKLERRRLRKHSRKGSVGKFLDFASPLLPSLHNRNPQFEIPNPKSSYGLATRADSMENSPSPISGRSIRPYTLHRLSRLHDCL